MITVPRSRRRVAVREPARCDYHNKASVPMKNYVSGRPEDAGAAPRVPGRAARATKLSRWPCEPCAASPCAARATRVALTYPRRAPSTRTTSTRHPAMRLHMKCVLPLAAVAVAIRVTPRFAPRRAPLRVGDVSRVERVARRTRRTATEPPRVRRGLRASNIARRHITSRRVRRRHGDALRARRGRRRGQAVARVRAAERKRVYWSWRCFDLHEDDTTSLTKAAFVSRTELGGRRRYSAVERRYGLRFVEYSARRGHQCA